MWVWRELCRRYVGGGDVWFFLECTMTSVDLCLKFGTHWTFLWGFKKALIKRLSPCLNSLPSSVVVKLASFT